jgi:hypothetical protein
MIMAPIFIEQGGKGVKQGLKVTVHWSGWTSGYSDYQTQPNGVTVIPDEDLNGNSRRADKIFIQNPKGGNSLKFENISISRHDPVYLELDRAR